MQKALVLMNMWASRNREEFKVFLKNMFMDKNILSIKNIFLRKIISFFIVRKILKNHWENFEKIGWTSPMHKITENLVKILQKKLPDFFVTYSMRYTEPFAEEIIKKLKQKNIKEVLLFPLYPQGSVATNISSLEDFEKKAKKIFKIKKINPFFENKIYNEKIIKKILEKMKNKKFNDYNFVFSAHSMPQKIIDSGDVYQKHIERNVEILKKIFLEKNMDFASVSLAYQSKVGKQKWLEPALWKIFEKFSWKKIIIYPISFVIENSETVYELDIEYKDLAKNFWIKDFLRVECLNENISEVIISEIEKIN